MSLLVISSAHKILSTSDNVNFFRLTNPLTAGTSLNVKSIRCNTNLDNVNPNNTAGIYIDTGSQSFPISLLHGKYNYVDLAAVLQSALNATGSGTYNVLFTGSYVINSSISFAFRSIESNKSIWDMIGVKKDVFSTNHGGYPVNINATDYLYFSSRELCYHQSHKDIGTASLDNVLIAVPYIRDNQLTYDEKEENGPLSIEPQTIFYDPHERRPIRISESQTIRDVDIRIYDDDGNPITEYVSYTVVMEVF